MTRAALYVRVSTADQNVENQLADLRRMAQQRGWEIVGTFADTTSGAKDSRPALSDLQTAIRQGRVDLVAFWSLDRLGRSLTHLLATLTAWQAQNVAVVSYREAEIDTSTPAGRLMCAVFGAFAEFERGRLKERVHAGLARARARGVQLGRPAERVDLRRARELLDQGATLADVARTVGVSPRTLKRRLAA